MSIALRVRRNLLSTALNFEPAGAAGGIRSSIQERLLDERHSSMTDVDALAIRFQCPKCGHELEQAIGQLKSGEHMRCVGCGVGINIDTNRLANAADEIQKAIEKVPPEITIKFYR
jgi:transcription elongation factor Elf1